MPASICSLPFDLLHGVAVLLDIRAYISLGRANKRLYELLKDENAARQCLEVSPRRCSWMTSDKSSAMHRTIGPLPAFCREVGIDLLARHFP